MKLPKILITVAIAIFPIASFAKPASCSILTNDGKRLNGWIQITNDKGMKFTYAEQDNGPGIPLAHGNVRAVVFSDEGDIMGPARDDYSRGRFAEAETKFKQVAEDYANLWGIKREQLGSFACEARYFHIDCLRRLGRFAEIGPAMDTPTGKGMEASIDESFLPKLKFFKMWQSSANKDWANLQSGLSEFEKGKTSDLVSTSSFEGLPPNVLVQLYYMRGNMLAEKGEDTEAALRDYYRCMTLDYGSDSVLSQMAMEAALAIQAKVEDLKESYPKQTEIHALARVLQEGYKKGDIDIQYREFTREPDMPDSLKAQLAAQKEAKEEEAAPEEAPAPPAEEEKPAAKGKGKAKTKKGK